VLVVARSLLGCLLVHDSAAGTVAVRLTEVEAYAGADDPASHAHRGPTPRTAVMFGPAGHAYVYLSYGMHWCLNVVAGPAGAAAAVLLRAGEVVRGEALASSRSGRGLVRSRDLARGPARLTRSLGVDRAVLGADLCDPVSRVRLLGGDPVAETAVASGPRVGISRAVDLPWRLWLVDDPTVSAFRRGRPSRSGTARSTPSPA